MSKIATNPARFMPDHKVTAAEIAARPVTIRRPMNFVDEVGHEHWHIVPATGEFRLRDGCEGCDVWAGDTSDEDES